MDISIVWKYLLNCKLLNNYLSDKEINKLYILNRRLCNIQFRRKNLKSLYHDLFGIIFSYSTVFDLFSNIKVNKYFYIQVKNSLIKKKIAFKMFNFSDEKINIFRYSFILKYVKILIIVVDRYESFRLGTFITDLACAAFNNVQVLYVTTSELLEKVYPNYNGYIMEGDLVNKFIFNLNKNYYHNIMLLKEKKECKIKLFNYIKSINHNKLNLRFIIIDSDAPTLDNIFYLSLYYFCPELIDIIYFKYVNVRCDVRLKTYKKIFSTCNLLKSINFIGFENVFNYVGFDEFCNVIHQINIDRKSPIYIIRILVYKLNEKFRSLFLEMFKLLSHQYNLYVYRG